jgi:hypothetical protein
VFPNNKYYGTNSSKLSLFIQVHDAKTDTEPDLKRSCPRPKTRLQVWLIEGIGFGACCLSPSLSLSLSLPLVERSLRLSRSLLSQALLTSASIWYTSYGPGFSGSLPSSASCSCLDLCLLGLVWVLVMVGRPLVSCELGCLWGLIFWRMCNSLLALKQIFRSWKM